MKFNTKSNITNRTINLAGGEAFAESPKLALVSLLLTSFVKDQYYRKGGEALTDLTNLIDAISDKRFVAKAALYARNEFGMRSITHALAGELALRVKGETWTKTFFDKIIHRPDDMAEILAYYYGKGMKNEPNALKKGFAKAFSRFDEYQLAKYKGDGNEVSLIDIANLVHPVHSPAIEKLMKGTLTPANTWETGLTQAGQKGKTDEEKEKLKKEVWSDLLMNNKLGYFALLRNLRNILEQAPELTEKAASLLTNQRMILHSLVLPFRFTTAVKEMEKVTGVSSTSVRLVLTALNQAVDISLQNVPKLPGKTLIALDGSGSMMGTENLTDIASLFAAVLYKRNDADLLIFSESAEYYHPNPTDSTLTLAQRIEQRMPGGGTNFNAIFHEAQAAYERVVILSDMQGWMDGGEPTSSFGQYKKRFTANPKIYSFDLTGYGSLQFPEQNVFAIAGFSEKIFEVMKLLEQDRQVLVAKIEEVEL